MQYHRRLFMGLATALLASALLANSGKPNFAPSVFGDGKVWGTKSAAVLQAPNEYNAQSYDKLFVFVNGATGQLPVAEAAPGNPSYNGGRWFTHMVMWTEAGSTFFGGTLPVLMSYEEIKQNEALGYLTIAAGSPAGGPPNYFECPLLPVK
ncbi:MAG: hypothetical protein HYZ57_08885 [Acidobacteria bacterium]|nr:hypothetical protein [Acidobacteriota bacterium]MBI3279940.1 hypothetical protein [Acidobacteriota bacterium]